MSGIMTDEQLIGPTSHELVSYKAVVLSHLAANALIAELRREITELKDANHKMSNVILKNTFEILQLRREIAVLTRAIEFLREGQQYISPENAMLVARGQIESERAEIEKEAQE